MAMPYCTLHHSIRETPQQLLRLITEAPHKTVRRRLQILYLYTSGQARNASEISRQLGVSPQTVRKVFATYESEGMQAVCSPPSTGRRQGKLLVMNEEQLEIIRQELADPLSPYTSYTHLAERMGEVAGRPLRYTTAYRIVRQQLKAKLKRPRPTNLRKDIEREGAVKKNHAPHPTDPQTLGQGAGDA